MPKQIKTGAEAVSRLAHGALKLVRVVRITYGPQGRNVLLQRFGGLLPTKDGITVAKEVVLDDLTENLGCTMLKQACLEVNNEVGDGTTATAIIAGSLVAQGLKLKATGVDLTRLLRDLQKAATRACAIVREAALDVEAQDQLEQVAFIASNGDRDMANKIAEGCVAVGVDGAVVVEEGQSTQLELIQKEGLEIDRGWDWDMRVVADEKEKLDGMKEIIEGPVVAVVGAPLESKEDVVMMMEEASQFKRQVVIIAERIDGYALSVMAYSCKYRSDFWKWIHAPGFTHQERLDNLRDIAALAGAHYIDPLIDDHKEHFKTEWLGALRKVTLWPHKAILEGYDDKIEFVQRRIFELKNDAQHTTSDYDRDRIERRIARLVGGLCSLRVGGFTESEIKEKTSRVEDALRASQAALKGGIVPGGGAAYFSVARELDASRGPAWAMLSEALHEPIRQLMRNAGMEPHLIVDRLPIWEPWGLGDENTVDAALVVEAAIQKACSIAVLLLGAEATITGSGRDGKKSSTG